MPNLFVKNMVTRDGMRSGNCILVAASDALYVFPAYTRGRGLIGELGNQLGGVSKTIAALAQGKYSCRAIDVPQKYRSDPAWPKSKDDAVILAIPRADGSLRHPKFSNELHLHFGTAKLKLSYPWFSHGKLFAHLRECGWTIN